MWHERCLLRRSSNCHNPPTLVDYFRAKTPAVCCSGGEERKNSQVALLKRFYVPNGWVVSSKFWFFSQDEI